MSPWMATERSRFRHYYQKDHTTGFLFSYHAACGAVPGHRPGWRRDATIPKCRRCQGRLSARRAARAGARQRARERRQRILSLLLRRPPSGWLLHAFAGPEARACCCQRAQGARVRPLRGFTASEVDTRCLRAAVPGTTPHDHDWQQDQDLLELVRRQQADAVW